VVNPSRRGERPSVKRKITFFSILGMIVLLGLFIIVGLPALFAYDRNNLDSIVCTVSSVEEEVGPRTGTSILINTQECGQLRFSDGVTSENWKSVAENFKLGRFPRRQCQLPDQLDGAFRCGHFWSCSEVCIVHHESGR
jgi:hypothetical protein